METTSNEETLSISHGGTPGPGETGTPLRDIPQIVPSISGHDLIRTHFTFTNLGPTAAYSISVDTLHAGEHTLDFELIDELRPGASLTCLSIAHPVVGNDPHWVFEFWTASGEDFALPFVIRYRNVHGESVVVRHILAWDGRRPNLLVDRPAELASRSEDPGCDGRPAGFAGKHS